MSVFRFFSFVFAALVALTLVQAFGTTPASSASGQMLITPNTDYYGFDYDIHKDVSLSACIATCKADSKCQAFTYNNKSGWCFVKSDFSRSQAFDGTTAGRKTMQALTPAGEARPQAPDPAFITKAMRDKADSLPGRMKDWYKPGKKGFVELRKEGFDLLAAKKGLPAAKVFGKALALYTDDAPVWIAYSRGVLQQNNLRGKRRTLVHEVSTSSAILAYRVSADAATRADALSALAEVLTTRGDWRMAMKAYKAGLALDNSPEIRKKLAALRANHGFRVTKHQVDADATNPRICLRFSSNLKEDVDYSAYVRVDGQAPAALKRNGNRQLCIESIKHAATYAVSLRKGLPSVGKDEVLEDQVDLKIYVRDRAPAVRFTSSGFVLPRIGSKGIPVVSVNADEVDISIYSVNERNLSNLLQKGTFLEQLTKYRASLIGKNSGEKVWTGKLEIAQKRNHEVTTSFPVEEAVPARKPGVYVMVASVKGKQDDWEQQATQWFVISDIGLTSLSGTDGLHVFARSLSTAQPLENIDVRLMSRNNTVLATAKTDNGGYVRFEPGMTRGTDGNAPALVLAQGTTGDTVLIDLAKAAFDLSDRGVSGRAAPPPMDAYLYTERGIYRPGATVHAISLLRNQKAEALSGVPLTFITHRPDGIEHRRYTVNDSGLGSYALDIPLVSSAQTGTWRIVVHADPKKPALAETAFLVEDFIPDRFEFDLKPAEEWLTEGQTTPLNVSGRFLYGAPAAGLRLAGEMKISTTRALPGFTGYHFGLASEEGVDDSRELDSLPNTDEKGAATINLTPSALPVSSRPLEALITVRMIEMGGRAVERRTHLPIRPANTLIGIKPQFKGSELGEGETAKFDLIAVARGGARTALQGVKWELVKIERSFQWYRKDGYWNYESVEFTKRIANGVADLTVDAPASVAAAVDWGTYRLDVEGTGPGAPSSSYTFNAGWYSANAKADTPDFLDIALDRKTYRAGETAKVNISPRHDGIALVKVMNDHLIAMKAVTVSKDGTQVDFTVDEKWGAGAYVTATLYRPMDVAAARGPNRAIGLKWAGIDSTPRTILVSMELPKQFRPGQQLNLPLKLGGLAEGEEAYVTLAAVDVGVLNLTGYKPPAPEDWYYGQRRLGMEFRDIYGRLINGMLGVRGKIRTGSGDEEDAARGMSMDGTPPAQIPVALFSGIVKAGPDGQASITLDVPQFNGTLRMMAVAWSKAKVGHASADLIVRDPVVVTASLPRFLAPGDTSRLLLNIVNTDGPAGLYTLSLKMPDHLALADSRTSWPLELAAGGRTSLAIPITARQTGVGKIALHMAHDSGTEVAQELALGVRPAQAPVTRRTVLPLAGAGRGSLSLDQDMLAGLRGKTASLSLSISQAGRLDLPGLMMALDRYPYGCTEQTTSRALPLLYLEDVAKSAGLDAGEPVKERVNKAIARILSRQGYDGGFGLWSPGTQNLWLSVYVADFLTRAREQGYEVPDKAFARSLTNLENQTSYNKKIKNGGKELAYALYVLARNGRASLGDLRYFADSRLDEFTSPLARAQLGAAFTYFGDTARAKKTFEAAMALLPTAQPDPLREDFGSTLRDVAAVLALNAESAPPPLPVPPLKALLQARQDKAKYTSTQEKAWMLLAAHVLLKGDQAISLQVNGSPFTGNLLKSYKLADLAAGPVTIANHSASALDAIVSVSGVPDTPLPAGGDGLSIERRYYNLQGEEVSPNALAQTQRLVVVLTVRETKPRLSRLLVVDRLPAGLEIDNPALVTSASLQSFKWLPKSGNTRHSEFRDDRFVAAIDRKPGDKSREFTLAYMVRAVTPGQYVLPPAVVEDMYRPHLNARTATGRMVVTQDHR